MDKIEKSNQDYKDTLNTIIQTIEQAQVKTVMAANSQFLWAYWKIGNELSLKIANLSWGAKVIESLSKDIRTQYPNMKGFSARNLLYMKQFAEAYPTAFINKLNIVWQEIRTNTQQAVALILTSENFEIPLTQQGVAEIEEDNFVNSIIGRLSWSHHIILLDKCPNMQARFWYMLNTIEHGNSRNILAMQIESGLFQRQISQKKVHNFSATLPKPQSDFANYLLKDPYIFDFVQAKHKADERNIEEQLTQHITKFLLELGQGFAFVGRQHKLTVGNSDFYIDLLFYHIKLHCYVVVELKAREFEPKDPAQLNFYINVINDTLKGENDNDTIGILLCKGKNDVLAEYALRGYTQPIGVADYEISKAIPEELKSTLPDIEDLEKELEEIKHHEK